AEAGRRPGSRPRDRCEAAGAATVPGAAARGPLESWVGRELPWGRGRVPHRPRPRDDHGRRDRRRDRGTDLPGVLPRTVRPYLLRGFTVRPPRLLGRRRHCGATGLRTNDGGGPCAPPPGAVSGNADGQPGGAVAAAELTGSSSPLSPSTPSPARHPCP